MLWPGPCVAASGTGSALFIDAVAADRSRQVDFESYRASLSLHIKPNAAESFTVQVDNDPKQHCERKTRVSQILGD